jgi:hypothetical protein
LGRWSYDAKGGDAVLVINQQTGADTAAWNKDPDWYSYPRFPVNSVGIYKISYNPRHASAAIDSIAHEWGHAVAFTSPDPMPYGWCNNIGGQLHEGFADVLGYFVERQYQPWWPLGGWAPEYAEWMFMEDALDAASGKRRVDEDCDQANFIFHRDEVVPNPACQSPAIPPPQQESHQVGNMLGVVFRLLTVGGQNPSCVSQGLGCGFWVSPVGDEAAVKILYRVLTEYLTSNASWEALPDLGRLAAFDLYSRCEWNYNAEYEQEAVRLAFSGIGYGALGLNLACGY